MKQDFFRLFLILGLFFTALPSLNASDQCTSFFFGGSSDFSAVLNSSQNYTNSDSANGSGNDDTYYISVSEPGEVTISVTGNRMAFSYDVSGCPNHGDAPDSTTGTYTFLAAGDFNLRVYRSNGNAMRNYTLDITFSPLTCNNFKVDDDKNQCSDACYTTITDAIDAASANQEILICDGTYNENLVVSKNGLTLKGESGNRANVLIQNSVAQPTVVLNGVNGVTLDTLSITNTSRNAVQINSYTQNTVLRNLALVSSRDTIYTNGNNGRLELYDSVLEAGDDGVDIRGQINGGFVLSGTTITSTDRGLTSSGDFNGGVLISSSSITAGNEGVVFNNPVNNGLNISGLNVSAQSEGLSFKGELNGGTTFSGIDITAGSNGVAIYKKVNDGMSVNDLDITAQNVGLLFNDELNGLITLQNMTINADSQALFFAHNINGDLSLSDSVLTSTNNRGMYVGDNAYGAFALSRISVMAKEEGLYFSYNKQISPVISDSNITSSDSNGIFTRSTSWTTFTLRDSCVKTENSGQYGLNHSINGSNSHINGSCFYATDTSELARAQSSGNDFEGNYWDGVGGNYSQNNINDTSGLGSCPHGCGGSVPAVVIAEYRMDECSWDGTVGEVKDEVSGLNATSKNGAQIELKVDDGGILNNGGKFDGINDYLEVPGFPDMLDDFSITAWFKTTNINKTGQRIFADDESNAVSQSGYAISVGDGGAGKVRFYDRSQSGAGGIDTNAVVQNDQWYFVAAVNDKSDSLRHLYVYDVNGNQLDHKTRAINANRGSNSGMASIGGETDSGETWNRFSGNIDEVKVFESALSQTKIEEFMNFERNGMNYDGSPRDPVSCGNCGTYGGEFGSIEMVGDQLTMLDTYSTPQMTKVTYKDNYIFSENPVIFVLPDKSGGNPANMRVKNVDSRGFEIATVEPQGEDGAHISMKVDYFAINVGDRSGMSGSQVYQLGNQLVEVGYIKTTKVQKGYDTGTNSWETILPKGRFCNPVIVTQIQGMANEPSYNPKLASAPYLTTATRVEGSLIKLALERSETDAGTITKPEMIAYMISEANVQDSFIDDANKTIFFETIQTDKIFYGWDDSAVSQSFVNTYAQVPLVAAGLNSRDSLDGGWFRKQSHTKTNIALKIDEDRYADTERSKTKNSANGNPTTPESGGIFVFDGSFSKTGDVKLGSINAVNVSERTIFDGNISTQRSATIFDIALVAREDDNITARDANISKVELVNCADDLCLDCLITVDALIIFDDDTTPITIPPSGSVLLSEAGVSYTLGAANKRAKIRLTELGKPPTCSFDTFAIRPDHYVLTPTGPYFAGENFTIRAEAINAMGGNTLSYNEQSVSNSFVIDSNETRIGCSTGEVFAHGNINFSDGITPVVDANFTGLANFLNISISENNGSEFARIDYDDTSDDLRLIQPHDINITVLPYEINVTRTDINASTNVNWLYMADVDDMNLSLHVSVQANNKQHEALKDFNATCYAHDINLDFNVNVINGDSALDMNYTNIEGSFVSIGDTLGDINKSMRISASDFVDGEGNASYALNVDRSFDTPVSPFSISGLGATITSMGLSKTVNNDTNLNEGAFAFYYGRVLAKDVKVMQNVTNPIEIEVYKRNDLNASGWKQNSLDWYRNEDHNGAIFGDIHAHSIEESMMFKGSSDPRVSAVFHPPQNGLVNVDISTIYTNSVNKVFHLDVDPWLWYMPQGFGNVYRYQPNSSDCQAHPCFNYAYKSGDGGNEISSGTLGGSSVEEKNRGDYIKKGIKVFR